MLWTVGTCILEVPKPGTATVLYESSRPIPASPLNQKSYSMPGLYSFRLLKHIRLPEFPQRLLPDSEHQQVRRQEQEKGFVRIFSDWRVRKENP